MRVAIIYRPGSPAPREALPELMQGMGAWLEKYGSRFSTLEFFATGGGFGVIDVNDSAEVHRIAAEHPFTPYCDVEIRPVVDSQTAMATLREVFEERAAAAGR